MVQACKSCGVGFDLDFVPKNPFQVCPNPACRAPLSADAVEHKFVEPGNAGDINDRQRLDAKAQLHNDVAAHAGTDTLTTDEKLAAGYAAKPNNAERRILRNTVDNGVPIAGTGNAFSRFNR